MHGADVLRIGAWGKDGQERHVIVNMDTSAPERRRRRKIALEALDRFIDQWPAGEMQVNYDEAAHA